jgi:hypothetical protein
MIGVPTARAGARVAGGDTERARGIGKVVDLGRTAGLEDDRREVLGPQGQLAAFGDGRDCLPPGGEVDDRTVGLTQRSIGDSVV